MGWETEIPDVVAGQPVESAWGNRVRDQVVHLVPTLAQLPEDEADGALAYVQDVDVLYSRVAGLWVRVSGLGSGVVLASAVNQSNITLATGFQTMVSTGTITFPAFWKRYTAQLEGYVSLTNITGGDNFEMRFNYGTGFTTAIVDNGATVRTVINYADAANMDALLNTSWSIQARNAQSTSGIAVTSGIRVTCYRES